MPIVHLEIVADTDGQVPGRERLQALADQLGELFGSPAGSTWIKTVTIQRQDYVESGGDVPAQVRPVFAYIIRHKVPPASQLAREARRVAGLLADALDRPVDNMHVIYEPPGKGRVAFGGTFRGS